ncbi:hypothetical protein ACROYT_G022514 [Oculina patagonica]
MGFVRRKSTIYVSLLIAGTVTVTLIFSIIPYLNRFIPLNKRDKQGALHFNVIVQAASPIKKVEPLPHRTYLISRKRCTEKLFLLIMVFTAPANFDRRNIIRKTWASDPSLKARWKTMFLLGQAVGDSTEKKYLEDEGLKYGDFIRGTQNENYYNLTLKTQMGVEWAAKYCDFQFLLKADDDVFVNPYRLMEYLGNSDTPKTELYLGRVASSGIVHRRGKYAVSVEEYNGTRYPAFCNGPAYLLSWDLVNKLVDLFDVKKPLKLEDVYIDWLYDLFHKSWNAETIPEDWCRGLIVKLPKKGDRTQCTNWRGVTLLSIPSKIFCKIIHMRLSDAIDTILRKEQAGFRPGVGCIDHIFTLRNIFEQCIEWNTKVHVNFIDLEKAFDSIHRDTLWNILLAYGCPEKIVSIIKLFYNNFTCSVIHKKKLTDWFSVRSGLRQGCVLSPMLFLVAIDWIMRKTIGNKRRGIRWTLTSLLEDLDFADDVALVSSTRDITTKNIRPLGSCQTTGLEHQQKEDQDNAAYRYTITSGIGE